jgi:hypothetical protein
MRARRKDCSREKEIVLEGRRTKPAILGLVAVVGSLHK